MRTARVLTVSPSMLCAGGGGGVPGPPGAEHLVPGGVPGPGGTWSGGCLRPGGVWSRGEGCTCSGGVYLVQGGTWSGSVCSGGCLLQGVGGFVPSQRGVSAPGGCTWSQGVGVVHLVQGRGVPGRGGCLLPGGVSGTPLL